MSLKLELAPFERVILGNCDITNGPRRTQFVVGKSGPVLRQKYIMDDADADTRCKRFYLAVQNAFLNYGLPEGAATQKAVLMLSYEAIDSVPQAETYIAEILRLLPAAPSFQIMKSAMKVLELEAKNSIAEIA